MRCGVAALAYGSCLPGGSAGEVVGDTVTPGAADVTGAGACVAVAVVTVTHSARAQRDERASPRKPKVATLSRSANDVSLEV